MPGIYQAYLQPFEVPSRQSPSGLSQHCAEPPTHATALGDLLSLQQAHHVEEVDGEDRGAKLLFLLLNLLAILILIHQPGFGVRIRHAAFLC